MGWQLLRGLVEVLYPDLCVGCSRMTGQGPFCSDCGQLVWWLPAVRCRRCAEPGSFAASLCPRCRQSPPSFERVHAPFVHEGPVANAIHRFKYEDQSDLARPLGELIASAVPEALGASIDAVCAIPLHRSRFLQRKYDQAQLLAHRVAMALSRPFDPWALARVRATERQVGETLAAREVNVRGAFAASEQVRGARLLLIDDVVTTGATASAATSALLDAGAARVEVAAVARAYSG